jgi:hypothetical protein
MYSKFILNRSLVPTAIAASSFGSALFLHQYSQSINKLATCSDISSEDDTPSTPSELALEKLKLMREHFHSNDKNTSLELTYNEFFLALDLDPSDYLARRIAKLTDIDANELITFEENEHFFSLLEQDAFFASLILDKNASGDITKEEISQLIHNRNYISKEKVNLLFNNNVQDTGSKSADKINVHSKNFTLLLNLLENDVLETTYRQVASVNENGIEGVSASDLLVIMTDQGYIPNKKLTDSIFNYISKEENHLLTKSKFRALFKIMKRLPKLERILINKKKNKFNTLKSDDTATATTAAKNSYINDDESLFITKDDLKKYLMKFNPTISNVDEAVNVSFCYLCNY